MLKGIAALIKGTARARWRKYIPLRERAVTSDDLVQAGWLGFLEAKEDPQGLHKTGRQPGNGPLA